MIDGLAGGLLSASTNLRKVGGERKERIATLPRFPSFVSLVIQRRGSAECRTMKCVTVDLTLSSDDEKPPQIRSKSLKSAQPAAKLGAKSTPASLSGGKSNAGGKEAEKREMWGEPLASSSNRRRSAQGDSSDEMDLDQEQNHDDSFSATDSRLAPSHQSHPASRNSTTMQSQHVPLPHSTRFWEPSIREAYNRFHGVGLKLSDLCGDLAKLQRVILSSYCLDQDWVLGHFVNHLGIKVLLVHPDFSEYRKPGDVRYQEGTNWSWVVPAFAGRNTNGKDKENGLYHVKFIVLVFDTFTRVVITSANMMHYDWSDIGNSIVVQDFPFLPPTSATPKSPADNPTHSPMFSLPLCQLFERFQIPGPFLEFFGRCDWTESGRDDSMRLVVCNSGTWVGWEEMEKGGGLLSLANAVEDCGFEEEGTWEVEAAVSSYSSPSCRIPRASTRVANETDEQFANTGIVNHQLQLLLAHLLPRLRLQPLSSHFPHPRLRPPHARDSPLSLSQHSLAFVGLRQAICEWRRWWWDDVFERTE